MDRVSFLIIEITSSGQMQSICTQTIRSYLSLSVNALLLKIVWYEKTPNLTVEGFFYARFD